jgi:Fe-S-cluster containining protein
MPRPPDRSADADLLADLQAVYRDADLLHAGWSCPASTECCRFGVTGREPYVTSIELAAVKKAAAARGGMRSWKKAPPLGPSLPVVDGSGELASSNPSSRGVSGGFPPTVRDERRCPFLDASGRCAVYEARPLGCRTFYCERADAGGKVKQREVNALVRRIQDIAARHEPEGDKGRPLTRAL